MYLLLLQLKRRGLLDLFKTRDTCLFLGTSFLYQNMMLIKDIICPRGFKMFKIIPQTPTPTWVSDRNTTKMTQDDCRQNWKQASLKHFRKRLKVLSLLLPLLYRKEHKIMKLPLKRHQALPLSHSIVNLNELYPYR